MKIIIQGTKESIYTSLKDELKKEIQTISNYR